MTAASHKLPHKIAQEAEQAVIFNGLTGHDKDYYGCLVDDLVEACQDHSSGDSDASAPSRQTVKANAGRSGKGGRHGS